ncbi:MAG: FkbM family methyltransferase [Bacteroidota bacterium]
MSIKNAIRLTLNFLHLDLTKNLEYDRLTKAIMKRVIQPYSNCIDVGCHKGEILDTILQLAPNGTHFGFEPIPSLYNNLKQKYADKATIYPYALADANGKSTFQFVKNAPAYSGLKKRRYDTDKPDIEEIEVEIKTLDELIPNHLKINFVKIDVEGAEFGVLKGARELLKRDKPVVVFECGMGASDYYDTKPAYIFAFITNEIGLSVSTLKSFINNGKPLTADEFADCFNNSKEYYFIAHA